MNWRRWRRRADAYLVRVVIVILVAALVWGFFLLFCRDYVLASGNEPVTRQFSASAEAAVTSDGDLNGFETTPTNAYADGSGSAVDEDSGAKDNSDPTGTGTDKHNYSSYGLLNAIPADSTINGITVGADIAVDSTVHSPYTAIRLSYDGGTSWTAVKQITLTGAAETTYTYGGTSDDWGYAWTTSDLSDANFRVQVINGDTRPQASLRDFSLDWIPVSITFTAPWESYSDEYYLVQSDNFTDFGDTVYMEGTGFTAGYYHVGYYDADGIWVVTDENKEVLGDGILNTNYNLSTDAEAVGDGYWHALVQPSSGYASFPSTYDTAIGAPDTYGLLANDSFYVAQEAIPEFPTVMAAIVVAAVCFGIYYWMRRRRKLAYVKA